MDYSTSRESDQLIDVTVKFVKQALKNAEGGHDWWHIQRVWKNTQLILQKERADKLVCELAALMHDIADAKFHNGDDAIGPRTAEAFLKQQGVPAPVIEHVVQIIRHMSFSSALSPGTFTSLEMQVVQDADRLDAIGAIGIARAFNYGGYKKREMYNPEIPSMADMTKEEYKKSTAPTINHFYEKLLLLKEKMNTDTARKIAQQRHAYMEGFLQQFYAEWEGRR